MSPATWMFRSYWSVQNRGGSLCSFAPSIMLDATEIAWFCAFAQVSTRIARPWQRLHCKAASPAPNTPAAAGGPPALPRQSNPFGHRRHRLDANADQHEVCLYCVAIAEPDAIRRRSGHGRAKDECDAMAAVFCGEEVADEGRECPGQQPRLALDHRDTASVLGGRTGHLESDHAAADDHDPGLVLNGFAKAQCIFNIAQVLNFNA